MATPKPRSLGERRKQVGKRSLPVVNPKWILLSYMFAGVWLAWPWALLNEVLMKSDDVRRQAKIIAVGLLGAFGLAALVMWLVGVEALTVRQAKYALIFLIAWKLGISYLLDARQAKTFELWKYFGGTPRAGLYVVIAGAFVADAIFAKLPFGLLWLVLR